MRTEKVSVCIASYNGNKYIKYQIKSILKELNIDDEIIIIDDCSTDETINEILSFNDPRIRLFQNSSNVGNIKTFEKAIFNSSNDFIFLADHDDVWTDNRIEIMMNELRKEDIYLVSGNSLSINEDGLRSNINLGSLKSETSKKHRTNIIKIFIGKSKYFGCCMAFNKKINNTILPFPKYIESHDLWIAMAANVLKKNVHIEEIVLERRIHSNNLSLASRKFSRKIFSRWIHIRSLLEIIKRSK